MPMWDMHGSLSLIRILQPEAKQFGYSIALSGSVLTAGESDHSLELVFTPLSGGDVKKAELLEYLCQMWGPGTVEGMVGMGGGVVTAVPTPTPHTRRLPNVVATPPPHTLEEGVNPIIYFNNIFDPEAVQVPVETHPTRLAVEPITQRIYPDLPPRYHRGQLDRYFEFTVNRDQPYPPLPDAPAIQRQDEAQADHLRDVVSSRGDKRYTFFRNNGTFKDRIDVVIFG